MKKMEKRRINSIFFSAIREGNLEKVRELINSFGLSYSEAWSRGYVLLCEALKNKNSAVAKLLLTSGSKVSIKNDKPINTPLHFAVINDDIEIVEMILDKGANVDAENQYGATPLHVAAGKGCLQIIEHLLKYGANVNCMCTQRQNFTPLHLAVETRSIETIILLLSRGANVDAKGQNSVTPLHIAAENGYTDRCIGIAEYLLNHGACIHSSTLKEEYTPLHFACGEGNKEIVKLFLNRGADINARTKDNSTPLHIATKGEFEKVVKLLLQHGAKVDNQDKDGKTILNLAVGKGNLAIVEDVLKYCPDINIRSNRNSLKIAVCGSRKDYEKIVKALLEYGITVNPGDANNSELLHYAVQKGCLNIIEDLFKYGADVNTLWELGESRSFQSGFTPLHSAARNEQEEVAKLLISYGANINAQDKSGKTPIFYAIEKVNLNIIKLLITHRADIKGRPELLNIAVEKKCIEIVEALLENGADINAINERATTALHFTALNEGKSFYRVREKNPDIDIEGKVAELLLNRGANVDAQTKDGVTTLHAAAENEHVEVVEALLKYNANVNCKDKNDNTPLHHSARKGNEDISKVLLDKGANVNTKQKDGITPLHFAAQEGHIEVVIVLLKRGAEVDSKLENDMTPLHLAAQKGRPTIIDIILEFGADINSTDEHGRTALHIASEKGQTDSVDTLLNYGSDINITSNNNQTALDYATDGIRSSLSEPDYDSDHSSSDDDSYGSSRLADFDECSHENVAEALRRHIVQMKAANLYVSEGNLLSINRIHGMSDFQDECEKEIARMKDEKIEDLNISFYDILVKDPSSLVIYMRNEDVHVFDSNDNETKFPIYASLIENHFRRGIKKKELLEQGNLSFHYLSKNLTELPYDCIEKIINHLRDGDLRNLIDACKPLGIGNFNTQSCIDYLKYIPSITSSS